jgi:hypothetical protein
MNIKFKMLVAATMPALLAAGSIEPANDGTQPGGAAASQPESRPATQSAQPTTQAAAGSTTHPAVPAPAEPTDTIILGGFRF